jgi:hypothetical protein
VKKRMSFVSNSSSSSFLIAFKREPATINWMINALFPNDPDQRIRPSYADEKDFYMTGEDIATQVYNDIEKPLEEKEILEMFVESYEYRVEDHRMSQVYGIDGKGYWCDKSEYLSNIGCWGSDPELLKQIRDQTIARENEYKAITDLIAEVHDKYRKDNGLEQYAPANEKERDIFYKKASKLDKEFNKLPEIIKLEERRRKAFSARYENNNTLELQLAKKDYAKLKEKGYNIFYKLEYSDNEGEQNSLMEHANIFRNIPNIRISNH